MASCENVCRLCTKTTTSSVYISHTDSDKMKYIDKLKYVFNDVILEEDNKTAFQICSPCCKKLRQVYDFKKQCTSSYEFWQLHFHPNKMDIKVEPILKAVEIPTPTRKRGRPRKDATQNKLVDTNVKGEPETILKTKSDFILQPRTKIKSEPNSDIITPLKTKMNPNLNILHLKNKLNTLLSTESENEMEPADNISNSSIFSLKNKLNTILKSEPVETSLSPIQLNFNSLKSKLGRALKTAAKSIKREKLSSKRRNRKQPTEKYYLIDRHIYIIDAKRKIFFCKLCNKYFLNWISLKVHIVQDLGIKNFSCGGCKKRFFTHRELKIHKLRFEDHQK